MWRFRLITLWHADAGTRGPSTTSAVCQLEMTLLGDFWGASGATVRLMSDGEFSGLEVLRDLDHRRLTSEAAGWLLGLERQ